MRRTQLLLTGVVAFCVLVDACGGGRRGKPDPAVRLGLVAAPTIATEDEAVHFTIVALDSAGQPASFAGTISIAALGPISPSIVVMSNGIAEVNLHLALGGDELLTFTAPDLAPISLGFYVEPAIPALVDGPAARSAVLGTGSGWDAAGAWAPSVVVTNGVFRLYYASSAATANIGLAASPDGLAFTRSGSNPIVGPAVSAAPCHADGAGSPHVFRDGSSWRMIYRGTNGTDVHLCMATSTDGVAWTPAVGTGPFGAVLVAATTTAQGFDTVSVTDATVLVSTAGVWSMVYSGKGIGELTPENPGPDPLLGIGLARSTDSGLSWTRVAGDRAFGSLAIASPLGPDTTEWDAYGFFHASVLPIGNAYRIWATGYGTGFIDRIGRFGSLRLDDIGPELAEVVGVGAPGRFDELGALDCAAVRGEDGVVRLFYAGRGSDGIRRIGVAAY